MEVIPVIDLQAGRVVHARGGARERYRPVRSCLCADSTPLAVVRALLAVYPFTRLYVADLDAIEGRGDHASHLEEIAAAFPRLSLWVDGGLRDARGCPDWLARAVGTPVVGTETLGGADALRGIAQACEPDAWVLSLDYREDRLLGGMSIEDTVASWPSRVIVMTLGRVGSDAGPDLERLDAVRALAGRRKIYAAGGVRGGADLSLLAERAVSGVLVATALHDGRIGRAGIAAVASGPA